MHPLTLHIKVIKNKLKLFFIVLNEEFNKHFEEEPTLVNILTQNCSCFLPVFHQCQHLLTVQFIEAKEETSRLIVKPVNTHGLFTHDLYLFNKPVWSVNIIQQSREDRLCCRHFIPCNSMHLHHVSMSVSTSFFFACFHFQSTLSSMLWMEVLKLKK